MKITNFERIGEIGYNNVGSKMEIIKYNSATDVVVKFENGYTSHTTYRYFKIGSIKNPLDISVYEHGFIGEGTYKTKDGKGKHTPHYVRWRSMLDRSYSNKCHKKHPTYIGVSVCEEWLNFQNFAKWYDENYYIVEGQEMNLDKDILYKGNKIYSPEKCVFVPKSINSLFTKRESSRGNLPLGVRKEGINGKYMSQCNNGKGRNTYLGTFQTSEEAFKTYKEYKEKLIKEIAEQYKDQIPEKLYNAMCNYIVEITD